MKKSVWLAGILGVCCLMMTGCNKFSPQITGIQINEKEMITQVIKENFQGEGYSQEELQAQIQGDIDTYNEKAGVKCIKSSKLKVDGGLAQLSLIYASAKDFAEFNNEDFYIGNIEGAIKAGYTFQGSFQEAFKSSLKDEEIWGSKIMYDNKDYRVVVISEPTLVEVPGTIRYVSTGMRLMGSKQAVSETNELAYILYE